MKTKHLSRAGILLLVGMGALSVNAQNAAQFQKPKVDKEFAGYPQENVLIPVEDFETASVKISNKQVVIDGYWEFKDETGRVLETPIILSQPVELTDNILLALRRPGSAMISVTENGVVKNYKIKVDVRFEENNIEKELESAIMSFVGDPGLSVKVLPPQAAMIGANLNRSFGEETASEILAPRGETTGNATTGVASGDDFRPTILLGGEVANDLVAARAESIARAYSPNVVNFISIKDPLQVRLNVKIIELSHIKRTNIGITHSSGTGTNGNPAGGFALGFTSTAPFFETGPNDNLPIFGSLTPTPSINTTVNLHGVDLEAELLQEPTLTVLNGQPAHVAVGQSIAVDAGSTVDEAGNIRQEIDRINIGVSLLMTPIVDEEETYREDVDTGGIPWGNISTQSSRTDRSGEDSIQPQTLNTVSENGIVTMAIQPRVTSLEPGTNTTTTFSGAINTSYVETRVAMRSGEALVLGGLFNNLDTKSTQKVPFLSDIPLLGELFKDRDSDKEKKELIFVVTPKVLGIEDEELGNANARLPRMQEMVYQEGLSVKPTRISSNDVMVRNVEPVSYVPAAPASGPATNNAEYQPENVSIDSVLSDNIEPASGNSSDISPR